MNATALTPFDSQSASYLVLANGRGERSLWPRWREVPDGWTVRFGPAGRDACADRLRAGQPA